MTVEGAVPAYALGADDGERLRFGDVEVVVKASADANRRSIHDPRGK